MWATVLSFLSGPAISGAIGVYKAKLEAGNTQERIAADLAEKELLVQQRELELNNALKIAEIGKWYEPDHLFGYIAVIYLGTIVIYDNVLGDLTQHSTPALHGNAETWMGWIFAFYVGMRGTQGLARIIKR